MQTTEMTIYDKGVTTLHELQEKVKSLSITDKTIEYWAETLAVAKRLVVVVDDERIREADPPYRIYKDINDRYNLIIKPTTEIAAKIENTIGAFNRAKRKEAERKRREYEQQLADAEKKRQAELKRAEKKGVEAPPAKPVPIAPLVEAPREKIATTFGNVKIKERWTFEEVDIAAVPREYLMVDEKKVKAAINAKETPVRTIAGLRIYPEA